jgi:hypothetical protein
MILLVQSSQAWCDERMYSTNDSNNSRGPIYAGATGPVSPGPLQNK